MVVSRRRRAGAASMKPKPGWWDGLGDGSLAAQIRLVDLAGSERVAVTGTDGARLQEAKAINRSLAALCDVVAALAQNSRTKRENFVP